MMDWAQFCRFAGFLLVFLSAPTLAEHTETKTSTESTLNDESDAEFRMNLTHSLVEPAYARANVARNFLIAPQAAVDLSAQLRAGDFSGFPKDPNAIETPPSEAGVPIRVENSLNQRKVNGTMRWQVHQTVSLQTRWAFNFQKRDTHKRLFYNGRGGHIYANAMLKDDIFAYASLPEFNASALELPLQNSDLRLLILLPDVVAGGLASLHQLIAENVQLLEELVVLRLRPTLVRVLMPKFAFDCSMALPSQVDMPQIVQRMHIAVDEDGIGAVAPRMVLFWNAFTSVRTMPQVFEMNHPFVFVIRDARGVQFLGHLAQL